MNNDGPKQYQDCLSLADGYFGECSIVKKHNMEIGATCEDVLSVPEELKGEFTKLSNNLNLLSRAYELGLMNE